jgi:hypothetical protein
MTIQTFMKGNFSNTIVAVMIGLDSCLCPERDTVCNLWTNDITQDFTFIVGDMHYNYPWIIAHFLSPKVRRLHSVDRTITEFVIETEDINQQFELFASLAQGSTVQVERVDYPFWLSLCFELDRWDLYLSLSLLRLVSQISGAELSLSVSLLSFISSHFSEFSLSALNELPVSVLSVIISQNSLQITSEDTLCDFICSRISANQEYANLLPFLRFEYLSLGSISQFVSIPSISSLIGRTLWQSLCVGLICSTSSHSVEMPSHSPADGIISFLTRKYGGNAHDKGIVTITSKSSAYDRRELAVNNLADLNSGTYFFSQNEPNQWVCWDFHDMRLIPTRYSIRRPSEQYMRSWVVETSLDGEKWVGIDRRIEKTPVIGWSKFPVSTSAKSRFIRLTQTQENLWKFDILLLTAFEVIGTVLEGGD